MSVVIVRLITHLNLVLSLKCVEVYSISHHALTVWVQKHRDSCTFAVSSSFLTLR